MALATAVIGAGVVSDFHLSGLEKCPRTEVRGVCDVDEKKAREKATKYNIPYFTNLEELLTEESLDWVCVCTPVQTHFDIAKRAIEEGVAVLLEKPSVETVEEIDKLQEMSERNGVPVSVVHSALFGPGIRELKKSVNCGEFGEIYGIDTIYVGLSSPDDVKRGSWVYELPGGEFEEGLPHPIYLTLGLGGYPHSETDIHSLTTLSKDYEMEIGYDMAQVQYVSQGGALCNIKMLSGGQRQKQVIVHGKRKSVLYDIITYTTQVIERDYSASALARAKKGFDISSALFSDTFDNGKMMIRSKIDDSWEMQSKVTAHYEIIDKMALAVMGENPVPVPLDQARWTIELMENIRSTSATELAKQM